MNKDNGLVYNDQGELVVDIVKDENNEIKPVEVKTTNTPAINLTPDVSATEISGVTDLPEVSDPEGWLSGKYDPSKTVRDYPLDEDIPNMVEMVTNNQPVPELPKMAQWYWSARDSFATTIQDVVDAAEISGLSVATALGLSEGENLQDTLQAREEEKAALAMAEYGLVDKETIGNRIASGVGSSAALMLGSAATAGVVSPYTMEGIQAGVAYQKETLNDFIERNGTLEKYAGQGLAAAVLNGATTRKIAQLGGFEELWLGKIKTNGSFAILLAKLLGKDAAEEYLQGSAEWGIRKIQDLLYGTSVEDKSFWKAQREAALDGVAALGSSFILSAPMVRSSRNVISQRFQDRFGIDKNTADQMANDYIDSLREKTEESMTEKIGKALDKSSPAWKQAIDKRRALSALADNISEKSIENGEPIPKTEARTIAADLMNRVDSEGKIAVSDSFDKLDGVVGDSTSLRQRLVEQVLAAMDSENSRMRGLTEEEKIQAANDWADWQIAQATIESLERGISLSEHPLNNALAQVEQLYLEGLNPTEGDLIGRDINNAAVQKLAEDIDDLIQKRRVDREREESARMDAMREAELNARLEAVKELEQNAIAELEKARLEQNEEAIANLTLDLNMLTARVDSLTSELQGLITNRQQNTGRISIKQAKGLESPRKTPKKNAVKLPEKIYEKTSFNNNGNQFDVTNTGNGYLLEFKVNDKVVSSIEVGNDGMVKDTFTEADERRKGYGTTLVNQAEELFGPMTITIVPGNDAAKAFWTKLGYTNEIAPNTYSKATPYAERLDYQKGFVSLKGEMVGDYIDANEHFGEGEDSSAWAWGNYFLASRRLDEENYYKRFSRWGPDLRYDGKLVNKADFFNKRGIYDDNTREVIAHATNIMDTKERVVANLEDKLAQNKEKFDKHIENVVKQFKGALGEKRVKEIIDDITKIILGKGFAVGPLATFNKELQPEEYKIQQKYRDDSGKLSDDVIDIYKALIDEFGGNHWFDTDYFTHDLLNLRQQEKSLEAVKKLDWDKFTGKIGMTYKGQDVVGALGSAVAKTVGNTGTYEANTMIPRILELFRDSLSKNKDIKTELANLEKPIKEIADTASTAKKEIKEKLKEILADKTLQTRRFYEGADVKEVEKELLAFVDGTNTADYYSFADLREKNNWDISSPEAMLADAVLWSRFNKKNYPENITKEADTNLIDLAYAIREANTKLAILKAAQKEFVSNKDFVYKPTASMYRSDAIPENKFLLDMGKSLEEQPSYVKDAIIKLYTETGVGIEPITWENIRLINPALPRIYNAKEILSDPKSEDFKSDKMRTINLYDGAVDRFVIRWRNRGLASAVEDVASWVKGLEQARDEFKSLMNRSDFPQNTREANERAYLEEADMAEVLKFLYDKVSKIPKDAKIEDYVLVEPKILDNTTGKSYYRQLEESLGKESNKAVFDSLNAKTAHEAASKLLLRYGIRGVRYWGKSDHRGFVTFEPTPVNERLLQETLNNDTLMAVHSMSLEGAMKALDLGGMAMSSMAITKVQDGVRGLYGDVVLLGDVRLAAPSRTIDVYDRDAWTPVVNSIIYEFDNDMYKKIQDLLEAKGQNKNAASSYTHNIAASMTDGSDPRNNTMAVELFAIYKGIDQDTAREQIKYNWDKPFTPLHEEYIQWYNDFLLKNAKAYIHMGWTPSGAVRKKPLNLENLVAEMKTQDRYARMGGDYFTPGDVLKFNLVRFKNLQEVRDAQGRIVPTEEAVEATREMGSRFFALASELKPDGVEGYDATDQRLAYALIYGKGSMKERLEGNGLKSDPESVKKVEQFVKDIKSMPVKYFEVKPRRAVRFDEFSGAILPTSEEYDVLEERLRDNGMRFVYRADTQEQKNAALQDLYKQNPFVLFQNKKTSASKTGLGKEYRGAYDPLTRAILFSKVSDVTTLFHESAHYWFDRNLRYYKTGMASPEWKDRWEKVMEELGVVPNARGYVTAASVKAGSEKFARSMEAYLKTGEYENAAMQWAHQDYKNMVGRVYRNLWKNYWGLEDLSPAVKEWFNMNGFDIANPMTAFAEKTTMDTAEEDIGNIVATDETKPDVPAVVQEEAYAANGQVVENRKGEVAIVPEDEYETDKRVHSKLPESAEKATGVEMEPIMFNRRSMSDSLRAARDLVDRDPVRAWEALKAGDDMIDGLYAGDIYRALISKYKEENNPTMIKTVVQSFANAARRAGRSVKAFDLETPTVSFEGTISSLNKIFATKSNDAKVNELVKQIKNFLHEPEALNKGWEKFKKELECK